MRKVAVLGAGAGGAAAVAELVAAGHEVRFWGRSQQTLAPFREQDGVGYEGVLGAGLARPAVITDDLAAAIEGADVILVCLPTFAHGDVARKLARATLARTRAAAPVVLNPGHTGGALEVRQVFHDLRVNPPPIAEFSTLTYVARQYQPGRVTITGRANSVRLAALPGGDAAAQAARDLYASANIMPDVLACDLANVNMVLHVPGAVLASAWVEATGGNFTFYVQGMTPGVARVMRVLDGERRAVARAFGHELPPLVAEMQAIGTVEASVADLDDLVTAIASGEANRRIKAPDSLQHRYYREDFGQGLLPFTELAAIAEVDVPVAASLLRVAQALIGIDFRIAGRTAARMGIAGLDRNGLMERVGAKPHGG
ncbi:MAG: opine dehydrogenase [Alphaproteobacteria bacterium]|nr:opine dehydrogenase [Alphaproteobacteria bacterium]